jgi:hypothetical protein
MLASRTTLLRLSDNGIVLRLDLCLRARREFRTGGQREILKTLSTLFSMPLSTT